MKAIRKFSLLLIALFALAFFNPTEDDFGDFVEARAGQFLSGELGSSRMGELLGDLGSGAARSLATSFAERRNFLIFSTYTLDLDGQEANENEWRFLGVAGRFFELHRPEGLQES